MSAPEFRAMVRQGRWSGPTAGFASGNMQVNLAVLPLSVADDFQRFCDANPRPCPLLAVSPPGVPEFELLGADIDLRTDLPGYRVWTDGAPREVTDITDCWRDDLVAFALGCSFGFEAALTEAGFDLPHVSAGRNVAMYDTTIPLVPVGDFGGNMVVSMRYIPRARLQEVQAVSGDFPQCHGAPLHAGAPSDIGISDLERPDYGDAPQGQGVPVFWACGVTPQAALRRAGLPFAITHSPGKMLVCDVPASWDKILNAQP